MKDEEMINEAGKAPHVVIYFSDSGGGHRSVAEAVIEALHMDYGDALSTEMVDFMKDHAPIPFNKLPALYPRIVKAPKLWEVSFHASDGRTRTRFLMASVWPYVSRSMKAMIKNYPADLILTVHPLATTTALNALGKRHPPFYTVVTDMANAHAFWFDKRSDRIFVATNAAYDRALANGISPEKIEVVGFPVAERYCQSEVDKAMLRTRLGWPVDRKIILVVGGGEGMGPLAKTAHAIDKSGLDARMVIVAGRNQQLKHYLESYRWKNPTWIYGFTRHMPDFMHAADILVTKAGPSTLAEGLNANLPIIMYAKLPGQEDGNITFIEEAGAGVYAPTAQLVVRTLSRWLCDPEVYAQVVENARRASYPHAAHTIARAIGAQLGLQPVVLSRTP